MELKIKLKWLYGFFTPTVYEHLLPVNYIVFKEGTSRYDFNRNLFEIIKLRIIHYLRMARGWDGGLHPDGWVFTLQLLGE